MNTAAFPIARSSPAATADDALGEALQRCARQDLAALRRIYDLTAPRMLGLLVVMLGDPDDAEALLQQCYLDVWAQAASFNPARSTPGAWLLSVVRQHAIDHLRARQHEPEDVDAALLLADAALGESDAPTGQRLLRLAYLSGRTVPEIARAMGMPAALVRRDIRKSLQVLGEAG